MIFITTTFDISNICSNDFTFSSLIQLDHLILATTTLFSIGALWLATKNLDIHPAIRSLIGSIVGMAAVQVIICVKFINSWFQILIMAFQILIF